MKMSLVGVSSSSSSSRRRRRRRRRRVVGLGRFPHRSLYITTFF